MLCALLSTLIAFKTGYDFGSQPDLLSKSLLNLLAFVSAYKG
ncbi:hypothetical protein LX87_05648 [Larkinella arboricola]|uniref:Uncharacterized protein n=1 Tax=Larkinella arboricola TaxID=643671 RepID=A0A327WJ62_LARAB|nr:hypothetical protein LX87_05648 [Larkinella arboricola]